MEDYRLGLRPLQSKLGLALLNRSCANGTHGNEEGKIRSRDRKIAKGSHDSRNKNELITGRRIPIDIYDRDNEMNGEVNGKIL